MPHQNIQLCSSQRTIIGHPKLITIILALAVFLSIFVTTNTHAAGTANIKTEFNAIGDGIADDSDAVIAAFASSDYDTIEFPAGEYRFTKQLTFATGNKTIIGQNATLFTDDTYNNPTSSTWAVAIERVNDITIRGINFELRQTTKNVNHSFIIGVRYASNIHIDYCNFLTIPNSAEPYNGPIDLWADWHNVRFTNNSSYMFHNGNPDHNNGESNGGLLIRNFSSATADTAIVTNNVFYKHGKDEMIWLGEDDANGKVDNVTISGNRFYVGEKRISSDQVFTASLYTQTADQIRNVNIFDNEIIGQGTGQLFTSQGGTNIDIYNNDLYFKVTPNASNKDFSAFVSSRCHVASANPDSMCYNTPAPNTPNTVQLRNNRTITLDSPVDILGLTDGANTYNFTGNQHIAVNAPNIQYLIHNNGTISDNHITVNGNIHGSSAAIVANNPKNVENNTITVNGYADGFFRNWQSNFTTPITYAHNTITTTDKRTTGTTTSTRFLMIHDLSMNSFPMTISDNHFINGSKIESDTSIDQFTVTNMGSNTATDRTPQHETVPYPDFWWFSLSDATPASQTLNFCNNTVQGFRTKTTGARYPTINLCNT